MLQKDVILKPNSGSLGEGVRKIKGSVLNATERERIANEFLTKGEVLIEECIEGYKEIQDFHPESLNTIRVVTEYSSDTPKLFASFIRFGRGSEVVDNAHAGGIYAQINPETGIIESKGVSASKEECEFEFHPDSYKRIIGFQIPFWEKICQICCEAHKRTSLMFVGWDVAITSSGDIEIVEGNHAPDVDLLQQPLKTGIKEKFLKVVDQYKKK